MAGLACATGCRLEWNSSSWSGFFRPAGRSGGPLFCGVPRTIPKWARDVLRGNPDVHHRSGLILAFEAPGPFRSLAASPIPLRAAMVPRRHGRGRPHGVWVDIGFEQWSARFLHQRWRPRAVRRTAMPEGAASYSAASRRCHRSARRGALALRCAPRYLAAQLVGGCEAEAMSLLARQAAPIPWRNRHLCECEIGRPPAS